MAKFINEQAESILIVCDGIKYCLNGNSFIDIPIEGGSWFTLKHSIFFEEGTMLERVVGKIANGCALIIDTTYVVNDISEIAEIRIRNGVFEHKSGDFGYLYFEIIPLGCICHISGCRSVNKKEVLKVQKLLRLDDASDFPPFTTVTAYFKYRKIKKLCSNKAILKYISDKE